MTTFNTILLLVLVLSCIMAQTVKRGPSYKLQIEYSGETFFDGWNFFSEPDPSHGSVTYVSRERAFQDGLAFWTQNGTPGIQVEHWTPLPVGAPRESVRIHSKALFTGGLFIIDVPIWPFGCGVWAAFWTLGYDEEWPRAGEIDIIESVNERQNNQVTIHTLPGCEFDISTGLFTGTVGNTNCDSSSGESEGEKTYSSGGSGCGTVSASNASYGVNFNAARGGVFALQWESSGIRAWEWVRDGIPEDIIAGAPKPETWGLPTAAFQPDRCNPFQYFKQQQLVLNVNLCGDWAGSTYESDGCPGTCAERIADPANLVNTVLLVNYIRVFQVGDDDNDALPQAPPLGQTDIALSAGAGGPVGRPKNRGGVKLSNPRLILVVCVVAEMIMNL